MDRNKEEEKSLLDTKWPGMDAVLVGMMDELEGLLKQPWLNAKMKADGPKAFKEEMVRILKKRLVKVDHDVLVDISALLMAPVLFNAMADIGKRIKEDKPCK